MKLEEEFVGRKEQFAEYLRVIADQLSTDNIIIRGQQIYLPDAEMEYKIRHKSEFGANKLSISIEWLD
ncbi:MAG: hypothetical protein WD424_02275 [Paenibacillaceae bacterium]